MKSQQSLIVRSASVTLTPRPIVPLKGIDQPSARTGGTEKDNATNTATITVRTLSFFIIHLLSDRQFQAFLLFEQRAAVHKRLLADTQISPRRRYLSPRGHQSGNFSLPILINRFMA
jgi:hypothetical protein